MLDRSGADKRVETNGGIWPGLPSSIPLRQAGLPPTVSQIMDMATVCPSPYVLLLLQHNVPKEQKSELEGACLYTPALRRWRQEDPEIKVLFSYITGLRPAWVAQNPVSEKRKQSRNVLDCDSGSWEG